MIRHATVCDRPAPSSVTSPPPEEAAARRLDEIRRQLALLARRPGGHFVPNNRTHPCRWFPQTVHSHEPGYYFTDAAAWLFIAECLEGSTPLEEVVLKKPEGKRGYVMKVRVLPEHDDLYIKLQLGAGAVLGRSFHYSITESDD